MCTLQVPAGSSDPQCLSADGKTCLPAGDCTRTQRCLVAHPNLAQPSGLRSISCGSQMQQLSGTNGYDDVKHWCRRAAAAAGECRSVVGLGCARSLASRCPSLSGQAKKRRPGARLVRCAPAGVRPTGTIRVLYMILEICNTAPGTTVQAVADAVYGNSHSMSRQWAAASLNSASMDWGGRPAEVIRTVKLPCSEFPDSRRCDFDLWSGWISANAASLGLPLSSYQYQVIVAPVQACAIGFAAGSLAFVRSDWVPDLNIWKHEVGHLMGLRHASTLSEDGKAIEYGDYSTPMASLLQHAFAPCSAAERAPRGASPA
jgi:hypothetical protein